MRFTKHKVFLVIFVIVGIAAAAGAGGFYMYRSATPSATTAKEDAKTLVSEVAKLMLLPTDEEPTIAMVSDVTKLKDQPFFAAAANGDHVLIYTKAKKAILYRPSVQKIIEVAPVNLDGTSSPAAVAGAQTAKKYTAIVRNGTATVGLAAKVETAIQAKVNTITVTDIQTAKKQDYAKTVIVDVAGDKGDVAEQLATMLGITVGTFPKEEASAAADFLIIVGKDWK